MSALVVLGVVALVVAASGGRVSSSFSSLPIPVSDYVAIVRRRRAAGLPAPGSLFGPRVDPLNPTQQRMHAGVDIACPTGTPLVAVDDGTVTEARRSESAGLLVRYETARGRVSCMHLSALSVVVGEAVRAGQVIGATGATGNITGAHLHLELKPNGATSSVDPLPFFPVPREVGNV